MKKQTLLSTILSAFLLAIIITLLILDYFDIPSSFGFRPSNLLWTTQIIELFVGISTLFFTILVAKRQDITATNAIISEKFFKISFISNFQRLDYSSGAISLKLKIIEPDGDTIKNVRLLDDILIEDVTSGKVKPGSNQVAHSLKKLIDIEHTDPGMDKEDKNNTAGFCYVRLPIKDKHDDFSFVVNKVYRFNMQLLVTDIFGITVKCILRPWFKYLGEESNTYKFEATHNFGEYISVKYTK